MKIKLIVIEGPLKGKSFLFKDKGTFLFGRSSQCQASVPDDGSISRKHFVIELGDAGAHIRDLGSLNGIWINGIKIGGKIPGAGTPAETPSRDIPLNHGDIIKAGMTVFQIDAEQGPAWTVMQGDGAAPEPRTGLTLAQLSNIQGYEIERELAKGGFGTVYLARCKKDRATVAVKVISPKVVASERIKKTVLREIECLKKLHHPNLVSLLDSGTVENTIYYVMDFCQGGNIDEYMQKQGGRLPAALALPVFLQSLRALSYIHVMGYVHRDLKPANILISELGTDTGVKISDFGLAKNYERSGLSGITTQNIAAGTCHFMPPEQVTDFRSVKPAADVWSIGATFYNMLTGALPHDFPADAEPLGIVLNGGIVPVAARFGTVPGGLAKIIDTALNMNPSQRYKDAGKMLEALREAVKTQA